MNVIRPGPHLPSIEKHDPGPTITLPWETAWEEVTGNFLQPCTSKRRRYCLVPEAPLWICKIRIQVAHYHQLGAPGALDHGLDNALNG